MKTRNICEKIVLNFFDIPVEINDRFASCVELNMKMRSDGIITSAKPVKFTITDTCESDELMVSYMSKKQKEIAELYHPKLVGILHEIGHAYTMEGTNFKRNKRRKKRIQNDDRVTIKRMHEIYRQIEDEKLADEWAIQWLIDNADRALEWSNMLCEEFPI